MSSFFALITRTRMATNAFPRTTAALFPGVLESEVHCRRCRNWTSSVSRGYIANAETTLLQKSLVRLDFPTRTLFNPRSSYLWTISFDLHSIRSIRGFFQLNWTFFSVIWYWQSPNITCAVSLCLKPLNILFSRLFLKRRTNHIT